MSGFELNVKTLFRAVKRLRAINPYAMWVLALEQKIASIRSRALQDEDFAFKAPRIVALPKTPNGNEYRPLSVFGLEDKIIDCLTARFFRSIVDPVLLPSCLAFRCGSLEGPPPNIHSALQKIIRLNRRNRKTGMFVAECDIKSFFDCVSHDYARRALQELIAAAQKRVPQQVLPERAWRIFEEYLKCYSFDRSVKLQAQAALVRQNKSGIFKWPVEDLEKFHGRGNLKSIGVPQGGALSCLVANAVLHLADQRQAGLARRLKKSITYLRYCDDMLILSRDEEACQAAFTEYLTTLEEIQLPAHTPQSVGVYSKAFWSNKSNAPYHWKNISAGGQVPWIQFLGYQIRHDGFVRVRPKSLKKQILRITKATDALLATLNPGRKGKGEIGNFAAGLRKNYWQILHRFRMQLLSISVGRLKRGMDRKDPMPMCWAHGFRGLRGQKLFRGMFVVLDRHRERQLQRVVRRLDMIPDRVSSTQSRERTKYEDYYGHPYSYSGQFPI